MEKEIKIMEENDCMQFLSNHCIGHLAYISGKSPFIIPLTYYYDRANKCIISYSGEGHKVECMRRYPQVALQVENINDIQDWSSVMVNGTFEELKGATAKKYLHTFSKGVQSFLNRSEDTKVEFIKDFSSKIESKEAPVVYCIHINDMIGKYRTKTENSLAKIMAICDADTFA